MSQTSSGAKADRWQRIAGWFLTLSYAIGSPAYAIIEARTGLFSERFDYSPEFLYLVAAIQFACALVLFVPVMATWSSAILTVLALGAVVSHFRIESPVTSLPAVAYTLIQIWYGIRAYRGNQSLNRAFAADLVLGLHFLFAVFAVFGGFLVLIDWRVAIVHVPTVVWSSVVNLANRTCPLTPLEQGLRQKAGQKAYDGSWIRNYIEPLVRPLGMPRRMELVAGVSVVIWNAIVYGVVLWKGSV